MKAIFAIIAALATAIGGFVFGYKIRNDAAEKEKALAAEADLKNAAEADSEANQKKSALDTDTIVDALNGM